MIDLLILVLTSTINLFLAGLVLVRNSKSIVNRKFVYVIFSFVLWTLGNYLADHSTSHSLLFSRLTFIAALSIAFSMIELSNIFPTSKEVMSKRLRILSGTYLFIVAIVCLSPLVVASSTPSAGGAQLVVGSLYYLYTASIIFSLVIVTRNFSKQKKHSTLVQRAQIRYLITGLILYVFFAVGSQLILPVLVDNWTSSRFGPIFTMLFIGFTTFAIIRHKLLDIRSFAIRALAYVLAISLVGIVYAAVLFIIGSIFINMQSVTAVQQMFFTVSALLIALTYNPIIRFFNRTTSKLFFRDAYDTQAVLDQIGKIIVGSIDLHKIEKSALQVLADALRPTYTGFVLKSTTGGIDTQDFVGEAPHFKSEELAKTLSMISKHEVVYDELEQSNELAQLMRVNDISFITPLITKNETIGYLLSGPKKSGNIYSQQDKSMVTIASNELAVALQNAQRFDEIQAFNITLQEKVDEATKELKRTNRKLVELDEAKDEFISMASHQLRTPLTSIKGYISMLVEGDLGKLSKQQQSALKEAFISSQRMVFLISDFLNVSRIRTGKFVIEPKEVDLSKMVSEEMVQLREMAESKVLKVSYQQPKDFPIVKLDDNKMRQVIMNMIDNAIYYTPSDGTIDIQLYVDGKDVVFKVIDTGIGVPKAEQHKLFAKFFRAANARKARPDGTGLGLFMAQKVVVAQNGSMIFESEEGKGSTFGFRFPLASIKP